MPKTQFSDKIVIIEIDGTLRIEVLEAGDENKTLKQLQVAVGGWIEGVSIHDEILMLVDEDGLSKRLEQNPRSVALLRTMNIQVPLSLVGPIVLAGNDGGSRIVGVPEWVLNDLPEE